MFETCYLVVFIYYDYKKLIFTIHITHLSSSMCRTSESAWLPPCIVLVINDNLDGLIFALSYICRCPFACLSPFVGVKVLLALHVLESRLREEDHLLIKAKVFVIERKAKWRYAEGVLSPSWCMGERHVNLHQARRVQERWFVLRRWRSSSSTSSGLMRKAKVWYW